MVLYLWSSSQAVYVHRGAVTDVSIAQEFAAQPLFFPAVSAESGGIVGDRRGADSGAGGRKPLVCPAASGVSAGAGSVCFVSAGTVSECAVFSFIKDYFPLLLVLSGGCNHLLVLAARWIFLKDEYRMSSRYEIQYQMGIVGILLTFALVWVCAGKKAQETEADKAKTRAPEKRAVRTLLKVCMLAFTVLTVFGNAWTTRAEIRTAPYRKAYLQVSRGAGTELPDGEREDLETYLHNDPDAVRDAMRNFGRKPFEHISIKTMDGRRSAMKVVILAGGFGTRISEEKPFKTKANDRDRRTADSLAYHEALFPVWIQ